MITDFLNQKLFSDEYHRFTLELYINLLNAIDYKNKSLQILFEIFCYTNNDNPFQNEVLFFRNERPKGSNLTKYINKGNIMIFNFKKDEANNISEKEKEEKIIELFKYILIEFFYIIIRSRERKYFGCYVDLIKFLINSYEYCANYFLEELSCYNTIIEYLINCPIYEIKKIIVSIIYCAMVKSNLEHISRMNKDKGKIKDEDKATDQKNNNIIEEDPKYKQISENEKLIKEKTSEILKKDKEITDKKEANNFNGFEIIEEKDNKIMEASEQMGPSTSHYLDEIRNDRNGKTEKEKEKDMVDKDEEIARKLQEEYNREGKRKAKSNEVKVGDNMLLENKTISKNVLKLIYNVLHVSSKINYQKYEKEVRFLYSILLKFSFISSEAKSFLKKETNLCSILNLIKFSQCRNSNYHSDVFEIDKGLFPTTHDILNPCPNEVVYGENDKVGKYILANYDFMLLCSLTYYKEKTKEEIEKNDEDIGYTFYYDKYIYLLIRSSRTRQDINFLANVIRYKCLNDKEITDNVLNKLFYIIERVNDEEKAFYDEYDQENNYLIYKNKSINPNSQNILNLLRSNVAIIIRKLVMETNDKYDDYRIKTILNKLFSIFKDNKNYYGISLYLVNLFIDIYEKKDIYKKYPKEINEIYNWINKNKIPPKLYEIKGIKMYRDERDYYHEISKDMKKEFDQVEIAKANQKIEKINRIMKEKAINFDLTNNNCDLNDFKFVIEDQVLFDNKLYKVTNSLDELIKIRLIDSKKEEFKTKNMSKKKIDIYEKEKISFWVETDDYRLRIKKLFNTEFNNK